MREVGRGLERALADVYAAALSGAGGTPTGIGSDNIGVKRSRTDDRLSWPSAQACL